MDLKNANIIITGGNSGFGEYMVKHLSNVARKIITIDINCNIEKKFLEKQNIFGYHCNLTDNKQTNEVFKKIFLKHDDINILINNAGVIVNELFINLLNREDKKHLFETFRNSISVNLDTTFNCGVNVAEFMVQKRIKGLILNISSISASGNAGQTAYAAAKAGVNSFTVTWSRELSAFGIRVAGLAPGFFNTPSTHTALRENVLKKIIREIPSRRLGELDELLNSVKFIIENDFFNGKVLELDGGMVLSHG